MAFLGAKLGKMLCISDSFAAFGGYAAPLKMKKRVGLRARMRCLGPAVSSSPSPARLPGAVLTLPPVRLSIFSSSSRSNRWRVVAVAHPMAVDAQPSA